MPAIQQFTMASKQTNLNVLGQRSRPCLTSGSQSQDPGLGKSKTGQTSVTEHPSGKSKEGHHSEDELGCEFDYHAVGTSTRIRCCVLLHPSDKNCTGVVYCSNQKTPVQYIVEKLESEWVWYERGLTNKSKNVAVKTTANKLKALLEIQKHVELFGGYIKMEEAFEIFSATKSDTQTKGLSLER